jgi:predicted membrane-bound spermidine synthase
MKLCAISANRGAELLPLVVAIPAINYIGIFAAHLALAHLFHLEIGMLRKTEDADIHPIALAIWMLILTLVDRLPATIAGIAIRQAGNLNLGLLIQH